MEQFNIYKNGAKVSTTDGTTFDFTDLQSDTEYTLGVSRVLDGRESDIVTVKATTKQHIPHSLRVIDKTDTSITVEWDSETPIGEGMYNLYLDNVAHKQNLKQRQYTIRGLQPTTEYKICLCGIKSDGTETPKVTIQETTKDRVVEGEPEQEFPLENKMIDGSFENYDGEGLPLGWESLTDDPFALSADKDFKTHGEQSLKVAIEAHSTEFYGASVVLKRTLDVEPGYYITALDYKLPEPQTVGGKQKHSLTLYGLGSQTYDEYFGGEGTAYVVGQTDGEENNFVNVYLADFAPQDNPATLSIDALRVYRINKDMFDYLNKGKMTIDRIKELFPYSEVADESEDIEQYHTGAGWYELPNGEKVRGKDNAIAMLEDLTDE